MSYNGDTDSSDGNSSSSEVEYEPIVVTDAEGNKVILKEETNPLAPIVVVDSGIRASGSLKGSSSSSKSKSISASKPMKIKKTKVFASKDSMLALIESINTVQDSKIQVKLDRDASYLQRLSHIEKATKERKSMKNERLDKIKDNLRKGGVRVRGENKKTVRDIVKKARDDAESRGKRSVSGSRGGRGSNSRGSSSSRGATSSRGSSSSRGGPKKVKFSV